MVLVFVTFDVPIEKEKLATKALTAVGWSDASEGDGSRTRLPSKTLVKAHVHGQSAQAVASEAFLVLSAAGAAPSAISAIVAADAHTL
jgi:hypothetical protein